MREQRLGAGDWGSSQSARGRRISWTAVRQVGPLYLYLVPTFAFLVTFEYYPALSAIYHSFTHWTSTGSSDWTGFVNFQRMLNDSALKTSFINVFELMAWALFVNLTIPLLVAELIFNLKSALRQYLFRLGFTIPLMIPGLVIYLLWGFILDPELGLLNHLLSLIGLGQVQIAWLGDPKIALYSYMLIGFPWIGPFVMLLYLAGLQGISDTVLDASLIDGASLWQRILRIDLPMVVGQIKLVVVLSVIGTFQNFGSILVLTNGGPGYATLVPGLYLYQQAFTLYDFGYASAIGLLLFLCMCIFTFLSMRYIRSPVPEETR